MSSNIYKHLFKTKNINKKSLELTLRDTQDNLNEFLLMLTQNTDMNSFDVLSVTRTDDDAGYSQSVKHPRITTQSARIAYSEAADIIPLPRRANG